MMNREIVEAEVEMFIHWGFDDGFSEVPNGRIGFMKILVFKIRIVEKGVFRVLFEILIVLE